MKPDVVVTAASILFGFLFAGFWWSLNRELTFQKKDRHFKFSYALLLASMALLAGGGIILPLRTFAGTNPEFMLTYHAVFLVIVGVFGFMLTEMAHQSIFQRQKETTWQEWVLFIGTLISSALLVLRWTW